MSLPALRPQQQQQHIEQLQPMTAFPDVHRIDEVTTLCEDQGQGQMPLPVYKSFQQQHIDPWSSWGPETKCSHLVIKLKPIKQVAIKGCTGTLQPTDSHNLIPQSCLATCPFGDAPSQTVVALLLPTHLSCPTRSSPSFAPYPILPFLFYMFILLITFIVTFSYL